MAGPTGAPRFVADSDGAGHADRAWACFLALNAADNAQAPIDYIPVPSHARGFDNATASHADLDFRMPEPGGW